MDTRESAQNNGMHEFLSDYFDKSATIVRQYADLMEHHYARPALKYASKRISSHPISMTFLITFSFMAFLPLLSFIGLSVFVVSSIIFVAFASAAIASVIVETIFAVFLISTLCSLFIVAVVLTSFVLFTYLTIRLGVLINCDGRSGVQEWARETRRWFSPSKVEESETSDSFAILNQNPPNTRVKVEHNADLGQ